MGTQGLGFRAVSLGLVIIIIMTNKARLRIPEGNQAPQLKSRPCIVSHQDRMCWNVGMIGVRV